MNSASCWLCSGGVVLETVLALFLSERLPLSAYFVDRYQKSTNTYAPYNKDWIKEKIYILLRRQASKAQWAAASTAPRAGGPHPARVFMCFSSWEEAGGGTDGDKLAGWRAERNEVSRRPTVCQGGAREGREEGEDDRPRMRTESKSCPGVTLSSQ